MIFRSRSLRTELSVICASTRGFCRVFPVSIFTKELALASADYPARGFQQVLTDPFWLPFPVLSLIFVLAKAVSGQNEDRPGTRVVCQLNVTIPVTNNERPRHVDPKLRGGPFQHTGLRFATAAGLTIRRLADRWMVRAVVDGIEM